ncbi:hypothetical protein MAR_022736 [Mya arenaria]|uniref:Uncharacterized protein n=1 Tax=Mya arenaria TaxID=6604 RepID=A0ABY7DNA6_MYAAR|nr:hypothetical protein MAR_022736 [Mya arenaria]
MCSIAQQGYHIADMIMGGLQSLVHFFYRLEIRRCGPDSIDQERSVCTYWHRCLSLESCRINGRVFDCSQDKHYDSSIFMLETFNVYFNYFLNHKPEISIITYAVHHSDCDHLVPACRLSNETLLCLKAHGGRQSGMFYLFIVRYHLRKLLSRLISVNSQYFCGNSRRPGEKQRLGLQSLPASVIS